MKNNNLSYGPSFRVAPDVRVLIEQVVDRVAREAPKRGMWTQADRRDLIMDLTACHANGCPVDWARMLNADRFNFYHDINGIQLHLDRKTGALKNFFVPRFALPSGVSR